MFTLVDRRKTQWIGGVLNNIIVYGKLISKKKKVKSSNTTKIEHYRSKNNKNGYLHLTKCQECTIGQTINGKCIIKLAKNSSLLIKGKTKTKKTNNEQLTRIIIKQNIKVIKEEMKALTKNFKIKELITED